MKTNGQEHWILFAELVLMLKRHSEKTDYLMYLWHLQPWGLYPPQWGHVRLSSETFSAVPTRMHRASHTLPNSSFVCNQNLHS